MFFVPYALLKALHLIWCIWNFINKSLIMLYKPVQDGAEYGSRFASSKKTLLLMLLV